MTDSFDDQRPIPPERHVDRARSRLPLLSCSRPFSFAAVYHARLLVSFLRHACAPADRLLSLTTSGELWRTPEVAARHHRPSLGSTRVIPLPRMFSQVSRDIIDWPDFEQPLIRTFFRRFHYRQTPPLCFSELLACRIFGDDYIFTCQNWRMHITSIFIL